MNAHVRKWFAEGRHHELTGGSGLIHSAARWHAVKVAYRSGLRRASGERILENSEFVDATLKHAGKVYKCRIRMQSAGIDWSAVIAAACRYLGFEETKPARLD
jgi:hypothetical protein